jgi:ribosome biogenesis GTPase A
MSPQVNNLSWFPGHMKKAADELAKTLKLVDIVVEVGDSRAPVSSLNSYLDKMIQGKKKIILFSKKDLSDPQRLAFFLNEYKQKGIEALALDFQSKEDIAYLMRYLGGVKSTKALKYERYGLATPPLRALVIGIPNVGKSTLINSLVGKKKARVANKPGETKAQQLVRVLDKLELFDTPGILQPNYDDKNALMRLAWLGSLNDQAIPLEEVCSSLAAFLLRNYRSYLCKHFNLDEKAELNPGNLFNAIADSRQFLLPGGEKDETRAKAAFLKEFRAGEIVKCVVDDVRA